MISLILDASWVPKIVFGLSRWGHLYIRLYKRENIRISNHKYIADPITILEYIPLPYGYELIEHTESKIVVERKYVQRHEDITPKIAVFKRIEKIEVQLQPAISLSQTTKHIFFSDIEGEYVENVDFEDLTSIRFWLTEIMSLHPSLFHSSPDTGTPLKEPLIDTVSPKE